MEKLFFNILQIIEERAASGERYILPTKDTFADLEDSFNEKIESIYYEISIEKFDEYIWFTFDFGKPNPRDDMLTNITTGEKRDNNRELSEAELIHQFFCLYSFSTNFLYISNAKKSNVLLSILKSKLQKDFIFKSIKKTKEEFMSILNKINKITFTETKHLFNYDSKKRQALMDLTGVDAPKEFSIEAIYDNPNKMQNFLNDLFYEKEKNSLKDLIICGSDEKDFEVIFNNDTFSRKIYVEKIKDDNGKYIASEVREKLLMEINK